MNVLPVELWYQVIDNLNAKDLGNLRRTCRFLDSIVRPHLWKFVALQLGSEQHIWNDLIDPPKLSITILPSELWKIHKVFGLDRNMFTSTKRLWISMPVWNLRPRPVVYEPPLWYSSDEDHVNWLLPLLPELFPNLEFVEFQFNDFRPKNCEWYTDIDRTVNMFPKYIPRRVEIVYRSNLRLHCPIPMIDSDILKLNFSQSPITSVEINQISPRVKQLEIETIPRNRTVLRNAKRAFRTAYGLVSLNLNVELADGDLRFLPSTVRQLRARDGIFYPQSAPQLVQLHLDIIDWSITNKINAPNLQLLTIHDLKQRVDQLPFFKLEELHKNLPACSVTLIHTTDQITTQLKRVYSNVFKVK